MVVKGRAVTLVLLSLISLLSLGLITTVDQECFAIFQRITPQLAFLAEIRIPSLLLCATIYLLTGTARSYRLPQPDTNWRAVALIFVLWLVPSAFLIFAAGIWTPVIRAPVDIIAFLLTGLLAEEVLFRGAIYQLAAKSLPEIQIAQFPAAAVIISALLFGFQHFQYHHFQLTPAAWSQVVSTVLMGIFFGLLRPLTGSIWMGIIIHFLNNTMVVFHNI